MSTFHGLEMARQALFAQQSALYTTGHNISNANTDGYSRQRVNFETRTPYPSVSRNRPQIPGQMGTGVQAGSVERVRNQFLDYQFRTENSKSGFWTAKSDALSRMERAMNEPSESGLSKTMNHFWESLQDLAVNPGNLGEKSVVAQRGLALAETFNDAAGALETIRSDLKNEMEITAERANSLLTQIDGINEQLRKIEPQGYLANDLYDERDRLIDELSSIVNIKTSYTKSGDGAPETAVGIVKIELADQNGNKTNPEAILLGDKGVNKLSIEYSENEYKSVSGITIGDGAEALNVNISDFTSQGSLRGLAESYGYTASDGEVKGDYPEMLNDLNDMAEAFARKFNSIHGEPAFFEDIDSAASITVNEDIMNDPGIINASSGSGNDGKVASDLAGLFNQELEALDGVSVRKYYESVIGKLGVKAQEANRMTDNAGVLLNQVENQRMSVSAVSLDEEMTNLIKFQHAYNAAARSMTATDELLDRIINSMGIVGR